MDTIGYKLSASNGLSGGEVIRVHAAHARVIGHQGKVLFTTKKMPQASKRDALKYLVLINKDASAGLFASINDLGKKPTNAPKDWVAGRNGDYKQPSTWAPDDEPGWYEIDIKSTKPIRRGQFVDDAGVDLLDKLAKRSSMAYANFMDAQ